MATSKYDRELRFIAVESGRLRQQLAELREAMPADPAAAAAKAEEINSKEERLQQLLFRKKEIEDSYIAAGMDIPDVHRSLNANTWKEGRGWETASNPGEPDEPAPKAPEAAPAAVPEGSEEELTAQIESITDELMGIEIKMLRADMNGDEEEKQKLSMMASSLRSRRETLVEQVKALKAEVAKPQPGPSVDLSEFDARIQSLESDNRAIRGQLSDVRSDVGDIKESLRQILNALNLE